MKKKVVFRADGNSQIGWGHFFRLLALADILKNTCTCILVSKDSFQAFSADINEAFTDYICLPPTISLQEEITYMISKGIITQETIVVLDGYNFDTAYQQNLKNNQIKVVSIDDDQPFHYVSDIVINHSEGVFESQFSKENYTKLLLGTKYALLRKPFMEAAKHKKEAKKTNEVFICFGGADLDNITTKALKACLAINIFTNIHVVINNQLKQDLDFNLVINPLPPSVKLYENLNADQMATLMSNSSLIICPASTLSMEALACKTYMITGMTGDNQKNIYKGLLNYSFVKGIGWFNAISPEELEKTIKNHIKLHKFEYSFSEAQIQPELLIETFSAL